MRDYAALDPCRSGHRSVTDWRGEWDASGVRETRGHCERCGMASQGWEWRDLTLRNGETVTLGYTLRA